MFSFSSMQPEIPVEWRDRLTQIIDDWMIDSESSQTDLATACGVSNSTISSWINGKQFPSEQNRERLAVIMHLSPDTLDRRIKGIDVGGKAVLPDELVELVATAEPEVFYQKLMPVFLQRLTKDSRHLGKVVDEPVKRKIKR